MQKIKNIISKYPNIIAALLLFIMFALAVGSVKGDTAIVDEIAHIPAGYSYLKYGDYRLNPEHPPLIKDLSGVPLIMMDLKFPENIFAWKDDVNGQWESGWHFIYHMGNNADSVIFWSRIPMILVMLLLGFYLYKATKEWFGQNAAFLALTLYAFSPNIIAHGRFVTTDVGAAAFMFISIYYFIKWLKNHLSPLPPPHCYGRADLPKEGNPDGGGSSTKMNIAKASIALALAQLAKFSAVLLIPLFVIITAIYIIAQWSKNRTFKNFVKLKWQYDGQLLIIFIAAFLIIGLFYWPHVKNMPIEKIHKQIETGLYSNKAEPIKNILDKMADIPLLRPHAYYLTGFAMVIGRVAGGNTTFFLGQVANQSFKAYFPVVYLAKTPLAVLILVAIALFAGIYFIFKKIFFRSKQPNLESCQSFNHLILVLTLLLFIFIYAYTSITGNLNIGFRHLIPMLPCIFALVGYEITKISSRFKFAKYILTGLLIWLIGANLLVFPHYVAYFNEAAGGIKNGYKIVTDSNVDWGQDLKRLKEWVDDYNACVNKSKACASSMLKIDFTTMSDIEPIDNIKVDYFGGGDVRYYFCEHSPLSPPEADKQGGQTPLSSDIIIRGNIVYDCTDSPYEEWHANYGETTGWIAVSATFLQNSLWYKQQFGEQDYQWLREREPEAIIGGSILVYNIR